MTMRRHTTPSLAARGARLTAELRRRPGRVMPDRRNPRGSTSDPAAGLSDEMRWLWSSLHFDTKKQRAEELAYQVPWFLQQGLEQEGWNDIAGRMNRGEDTDETLKAINARDPKWLTRWASAAEKRLVSQYPTEAPSMLFFDNAKVVKDGWWVHFTSAAHDIEGSGFGYGESDPRQLGLTTWKSKEAKQGPGYVFSFSPRDAVRKNFQRRSSPSLQAEYDAALVALQKVFTSLSKAKQASVVDADNAFHAGKPDAFVAWARTLDPTLFPSFGVVAYGRGKYGNEAVLFRADAVVAYHRGDDEEQGISWGPEAKDIHALRFKDGMPGLDGKQPPRGGIAGEYDDYEDVTYFKDVPTLISYIEAGKKTNPRTHRSRR